MSKTSSQGPLQGHSQSPSAQGLRSVYIAFAVDAALIMVFAAIGRGEHDREATIAGLFTTAGPFLAALAITWAIAVVWRHPLRFVRGGIPVWIGTVAFGMLFRMLSDQGTALPFVLVATGTLFAFLVGWRAIVALVRWVRRER